MVGIPAIRLATTRLRKFGDSDSDTIRSSVETKKLELSAHSSARPTPIYTIPTYLLRQRWNTIKLYYIPHPARIKPLIKKQQIKSTAPLLHHHAIVHIKHNSTLKLKG